MQIKSARLPGCPAGIHGAGPDHEWSLWRRDWSQASGWELCPAAHSLLETGGVRRWISHWVSAESADGGQDARIFTCCENPLGAVPSLSFSSVIRPQSLRVGDSLAQVGVCPRARGSSPHPGLQRPWLPVSHPLPTCQPQSWVERTRRWKGKQSISHSLSSAPRLRHHTGPPRRLSVRLHPLP